jgi:hypothetical protein
MTDETKLESNPMPGIVKQLIKIEKVEKLEHKEKPEKVEHKEKPEKVEHKEKPEKYEHKEKPEKAEHKEKPEKIEHKEKIEQLEKIRVETGPKELLEGNPASNPGSPVEQRLAALENAVTALQQHFIPRDSRPELSRGALKSEPDVKK